MDFEYGIIGGGPAGYTVAMTLARQGKTVVLFEKNEIGGTCLNRGCIPTKSLLHSSEIFKSLADMSNFGIDVELKSFDFGKIAEKRDVTVEKIRKSLELSIKNSGVSIVKAEAKQIAPNLIKADKEYKVGKVIVATGATPREIAGLESDGDFILTSDHVLKLDKLPQSVLIIGSGAIGIEWARIFSNFGVEVTIVELAEHLIPLADLDVSRRIERIFKQQKIKFYLKDKVVSIKDKSVTLDSGAVIKPDFILSAVGRVPFQIECQEADLLGDVSGKVQLAHYAIRQALDYNMGGEVDRNLVPSVIYGQPEIAWVGLREQDVLATDVQKVMLPITALGKSWCDDSTEGFIKIIARNNLIIGAHIISKEASALIHQLLIAMQNNVSLDELRKICFAHPTYSEGVLEAICRL